MNLILARIQAQAKKQAIRVTQHAQVEMDEEDIALDEVLEAIATAQILEDYPDHRRGACCLLGGLTIQVAHSISFAQQLTRCLLLSQSMCLFRKMDKFNAKETTMKCTVEAVLVNMNSEKLYILSIKAI